MKKITELCIENYEKVLEIQDDEVELHAIIAIHNTSNGPALGGVRAYNYDSFDAALVDVLRLAKGMTYKSIISRIATGGGKSVIIKKKNQVLSKQLLWSFAEAVDSLKGQYICAEDIGVSPEDVLVISEKTNYAVGLDKDGFSGDPSYYTAYGVFLAIQETARFLWGSSSLQGKTIAVQGLGSVGLKLAKLLFWQEASLIVADIDERKTTFAKRYLGAKVETVQNILSTCCDIVSPCAMGAVICPKTIASLRCKAIVGAANNQLSEQNLGNELARKNILYAPDYLVNSGGLINVCGELSPSGYLPQKSRNQLNNIPETLSEIFRISQETRRPTTLVADMLVEEKLLSYVE